MEKSEKIPNEAKNVDMSLEKMNSLLVYDDGFASLDLSKQNLTYIPSEIVALANEIEKKFSGKDIPWKEIKLSYNNITKLTKEDFENLNHFDMIHFTALKMKELPSDIKHLTNPIVLNFSFSDLTSLPKEIYTLTQLKSIRINWTSIENFDIAIKNLNNLVDVEVSETPFINTIYKIQENNDEPTNDNEKNVWDVKKILDKLNCEIIE